MGYSNGSRVNQTGSIFRQSLLACLLGAALLGACSGESTLAPISDTTPTTITTVAPTPTSTTAPTSDPTPTPSPASTPTSTPTPTSIPTPTLTPTPTSTPTPTPMPEAAAYDIESVDTRFVGVNDGLVSTQFTISVRNVGGDGGHASVPIVMKIDENDPESVHKLDRPVSGDAVSFVVTRDLALGKRAVVFEVGDSMQSVDVDVRAADIILEPLEHAVIGDGSIELSVRITNQGDLAAAAITVSSDWIISQPDSEDAAAGELTTVAVVDAVRPGESKTIDLPIDLPTGAYAFTLRAETDTIEVQQDNNWTETVVEVDYVRLVPSVQSTATVGYERDGDGVVEVTLLVRNRGEAPSGPIRTGIACLDEAIEGCLQDFGVDSILPGTSTSVLATLTLPQGETTLSVFAGANEDSYLWGDENVQQANIVVPLKPALSLALNADANVSGYWSDGTANVELTMSLLNEGYLEVEEPQAVTVVCLQAGEALRDCGTGASIDLADGFGPATSTVMLRVPTGIAMAVNLNAEGHEAWGFNVPKRILGVDRDVWECYSDRPGERASREGCGGWFRKTVAKWDHDVPVRVWVSEKAKYIEVLETVMKEVAPLVNLEFEIVDSKKDADIEVQLGVAKGKASEIAWLDCVDFGGCADTRVSASGQVKSGFIVVWDWGEPDEYVRGAILHELLHVAVPVVHRPTYDTLMGEGARLSLFDEALIRLHSHRLIEPGMTMGEVEELIVFNDELVDPLPETEYKQVWSAISRAVTVLEDAGSARFNLVGSGSSCRYKIGPAIYEVGDFQERGERLVHYRESYDRFLYWVDDAVWAELNGDWEEVDFHEIFDATGWFNAWSSPLIALRAFLAVSSDDEVRVIGRGNGQITVEAKATREGYSRVVVMVVDEETYEISRYIMVTQPWLSFGNRCTLTMTLDESEYGIKIEIPESLDAARSE